MIKTHVSILVLLVLCAGAHAADGIPERPEQLKYPPLEWSPPAYERVELPRGAVLYLVQNSELPLVRGSIMLTAGCAQDSDEQAGGVDMMVHVLRTGGSEAYPANELDEALEFIAAQVETGCRHDQATISFNSMSRDFGEVYSILVDLLQKPRFEQRYIEEKRKQMLEKLRRENDQPFPILMRENRRLLYPGHPYGRRQEGTEATIPKIARENLQELHRRMVVPENMIIGVAGDFDPALMKERFRSLMANWPWAAPGLRKLPPLPHAEQGVFVFNKELAQTSLMLSHRGPERPFQDYAAVQVMNFILGGGSFSSRLTDKVRSEAGLAYSVGAFFSYGRNRGVFGAYCQTKPETSYKASDLILKELKRIREESVSQEELELAKNALLNGFIFEFEDPATYVSNLLELEFYGEPRNFLETYIQRVQAVGADDVQRVANDYIHPDQVILLLVGNAEAFDARPEAFGEPKPIQ